MDGHDTGGRARVVPSNAIATALGDQLGQGNLSNRSRARGYGSVPLADGHRISTPWISG